jgi:hypothetical protein
MENKCTNNSHDNVYDRNIKDSIWMNAFCHFSKYFTVFAQHLVVSDIMKYR